VLKRMQVTLAPAVPQLISLKSAAFYLFFQNITPPA